MEYCFVLRRRAPLRYLCLIFLGNRLKSGKKLQNNVFSIKMKTTCKNSDTVFEQILNFTQIRHLA